jgi:hypothetical protein
MAGSGQDVLPLYDGFAPPPRYRFVNPPPSLADGNKVPVPTRTVVRLEAGGSVAARAAADDDQLVVDLPSGAVPAAPPNTTAQATITPLDPATLAPLPEGASPEGNAFRVDIVYLPDASRSAALAVPIAAVLTVPHAAGKVFASSDGRSWTELPMARLESRRVSFRLTSPGYVLPSTGPSGVAPDVRSTPNLLRTAAVAVGTVLAIGLLVLVPVGVRHRIRRNRTSAGS